VSETRAPHSFWLDGGYDVDSVAACPYAPEHRWWEFRLGDVVKYCYDPDERMVICKGCYVPRCGATEVADPCLLPRHHTTSHVYRSGRREQVGGYGGIP
jgi:hypothetical protein